MPFAIDESLIKERFVRASGPGGQNVNKVATSVELRFDVARSTLPADAQIRLRVLAGHRMTSDGVLQIEAHEHRTQARNREAARSRLIDLIQRAARKPRARRPTRPTAAARSRRIDVKKQRGDLKKARQSSRGDD